MNFTGLSATAIWASPVRNLTSLGLNTIQLATFVNQSLAGNATVNFTPVVNRVSFTSVGIITPAAGGAQINLIDGTNIITMVTIGASLTGFIADVVGVTTTGPASVGLSIHNTTVNAATYMAANMNWVQ